MITGNEQVYSALDFDTDKPLMGLTIREHFAAMAMQGVINSYADGIKGNLPSGKTVAEYAVKYADALIKELNKSA